jgi:hypothetical protein
LRNNLPVLGNQVLKILNTHWELMFLLFAIGLAIILSFVISFAALWAWRGQVEHMHYSQAWNSSGKSSSCEGTGKRQPMTQAPTMEMLSPQQASHEFKILGESAGDSYIPGDLSEQPRLENGTKLGERTLNYHEIRPTG